jgi:DNA-binding winged helix-turn-helix (wHTH) protein/Tfp pilus assembly protein PilF
MLLYEFGPFLVDPKEQLLLRDGRPIPLKPKLFDLLLALVENSGHIVHKNELMAKVWPNTFVEESNLTVSIFALRKVLGDGQNHHAYIETVPRRGYRFAEAKEVPDKRNRTLEEPRSIDSYREKAVGMEAIAVLPFRVIGAEAGDEYLGLGMTDALITRISNLNQIVVRATSAVRKYADGEENPIAAGQELEVSSVLDGSIQKFGKRIRVTVQLVNVHSGVSLWAEKFDERFTNIFAVEDSISEQVASALVARLTTAERTQLAKRYTENTQAHQAYLKGRYFLEKRAPEAIEKGIEYFDLAVRIDRNYALAYAGLADCHTVKGACELLPPNDSAPKAEAAALKAIELDDNLAEAHAALGYCRMFNWDWLTAERELMLAIELNPNAAIVHQRYSIYLRAMRRFEEALEEGRKAMGLDPTSATRNASVGATLYFARRYDQAIEQLRQALELDSNHAFSRIVLGRAYEQKAMYDEAIAEYEKITSLAGKSAESLGHRGHLYAVFGKKEAAQGLLDELEELSRKEYVPPYYKALVHTGLGEKDQAFEWLENAYQEHDFTLVILAIDPMLDSLRRDSRFISLLERVGVTPQRVSVQKCH